MISTLVKNIYKKTSTIKGLLALFVLSHSILVLMMIFIFPILIDQIGMKPFDLQTFGYSFAKAQTILSNLNQYSIHLYLFPQLTVLDVLYPFLLALFLSSFLFRLLCLLQLKRSVLHHVLLAIPFFAMTSDYIENICVILLITKTAPISESFVFISSTFTIFKSVSTTIAWISILVCSAIWLFKLAFKSKHKLTF